MSKQASIVKTRKKQSWQEITLVKSDLCPAKLCAKSLLRRD